MIKNSIFHLKSKFYGKLKSKIEFDKTLRKTDIIFICSKYPYLKKHLKNISNDKALIIPLLNGLSHFKILKKFGDNVQISYWKSSFKKIKKNVILHEFKNKPEILINFNKTNKKKQKLLKDIFKLIRVKTKVVKNKNYVIWTKLIRLSSLSAITSLYNCNLGKIRRSKIKTEELNYLLKESILSQKNL